MIALNEVSVYRWSNAAVFEKPLSPMTSYWVYLKWARVAVAYLGFQKGGAKFSLATSAHTKGGPNQVFQFF